MDTQKNQIADSLKQANNVLITVSNNPTVDQLSAAIGLTLLLNKLDKHAIAVFSGQAPSTIEFLHPEKTLEKTTDSLRDFIISLDKSKADKLRYKVEDQMVKIFITPYHTSLTEHDLEFSQGDFNVDVVVALGVHDQAELDQAITSHGRILHDATVIAVSTGGETKLGTLNWSNEAASSLCEMAVGIGLQIKDDVLDAQIATAFLTGIVAETNRFSNQKTTAEAMQLSSRLMQSGANQQLVATQLEKPPAPQPAAKKEAPKDGALEINHNKEQPSAEEPIDQIHIDENGELGQPEPRPAPAPEAAPLPLPEPKPEPEQPQQEEQKPEEKEPEPEEKPKKNRKHNLRGLATEPPSLGGKLTANSEPEGLDPNVDPLSGGDKGPLLSHDSSKKSHKEQDVPLPTPAESNDKHEEPIVEPQPSPKPDFEPLKSEPEDKVTLTDLEKSVQSAHVGQPTEPEVSPTPEPNAPPTEASPTDSASLDAARDAVIQAVQASSGENLSPVQALNAQPVNLDTPPEQTADVVADDGSLKIDNTPSDPGLPPGLVTSDPDAPPVHQEQSDQDPNAPPAVPPPMMPPF